MVVFIIVDFVVVVIIDDDVAMVFIRFVARDNNMGESIPQISAFPIKKWFPLALLCSIVASPHSYAS
jgi:hypothetical protein